jgi:2-keto-4-pentenoate hydratase/2-oxohepta-3-ene-1,7-dioic acid hydratase in catechol pathway
MKSVCKWLWPILMFSSTVFGEVVKYVRFQAGGGKAAYGIVEGEKIRELSGDLFGDWKRTNKMHAFDLKQIRLLVPAPEHCKVLALAGNYRSHLTTQPVPEHPEGFFKLPTSLIPVGENVVIPPGTNDVHFEAELVIVIGKKAKAVSEADALQYVLGVTCGNDISARDWQKNDRQWWRAKACDTFAPCGPMIVSGIKYDDLALEMRQNGEVRQKARTSDMIHTVSQVVSWMSRHITLEPGDLIYTGTPGKTTAIHPGDTLEVEIEGIGILRNGVEAAK